MIKKIMTASKNGKKGFELRLHKIKIRISKNLI